MTSSADNTIDELIKRVKASTVLSGFVFASEYPPREMPNPIAKYIVAVGNTGVRTAYRFIGDRVTGERKGALYEAALRLRVYAPEDSSGAALLRATSLLADAVESADTERALRELSLSGITYDTAARTVYRDLNLKLCYVLSEEAEHD